jgi:hypothetical protein
MAIRNWLLGKPKSDSTALAKIKQDQLPQGAQILPIPKPLNIPQIMPPGGSHGITDVVAGFWFCYDEQTEVLSRRGWLRWNEVIAGQDEVATRDTQECFQWQTVRALSVNDFEGELYHFTSRALDLMVTADHRMLVDWWICDRGTPIHYRCGEIVPAKDLFTANTAATGRHRARIPLTSLWNCIPIPPRAFGQDRRQEYERFKRFRDAGHRSRFISQALCLPRTTVRHWLKGEVKKPFAEKAPVRMTGDDYAAFMGAYLSEGSCFIRQRDGHASCVAITQTFKGRGRKEFGHLVERIAPGRHSSDKHGFRIHDSVLAEYCRQFGHARDKWIPDEILNAPPNQLRIFWKFFQLGDGLNKTGRLFTTSHRMADQLQEVAQKMGSTAVIHTEQRPDRFIREPNGSLRLIKASSIFIVSAYKSLKRAEITAKEIVPYRGKVWCPNVPAGVVYTRRNGKPAWCGQSALQPIKPMAPAGQAIRQYEIPPGANIIWTPKTEAEGAGVGYPVLRAFADSWDLLRCVIETVKDRLCTAEYEFRLVRKKSEKQGDYQKRSDSDTRIDQLNKFFAYPDGEHPWSDWLRPLIEDMLVLDASAIYLEKDQQKRIASLRTIDGALIARMLTDQGTTPPAPQVAYQEILYGLPAFDMTVDDLIYSMRNRRNHKRYGFPPVEQIMITIATGLNAQKFTLDAYCYSEDTEYLTRRGWLRYHEIDGADELATRQINTGNFEWQKATARHCDWYEGTMLHFGARSLDLLVMPGHRMLVDSMPRSLRLGKPQPKREIELLARDLAAHYTGQTCIPQTSVWEGTEIVEKTFGESEHRMAMAQAAHRDELILSLRRQGKSFAAIGQACGISMQTAHETYHALRTGWQRRSVYGHRKARAVRMSGDDYCAFMGMYLAEGSCKSNGVIGIAQPEDQRGSRALYLELLTRIFGTVAAGEKQLEVCAATMRPFLRRFGHAHEKFIPEDIREATPRQLEIFWRFYSAGDGQASGDGRVNQSAFTSSRRLADQLTEILQKAGYAPTVSCRPAGIYRFPGRPSGWSRGGWTVYRGQRKKSHISSVQEIEYHGEVSCFEVPHTFLYVRRNGKAAWCGNTSGNIPEAMCFLPQDIPIQRIREVQEWFDSILAGDLAKRRRLTFLPGYGTGQNARPNVIFPKERLLKDPLFEWLWQIVCYCFGVPSQALMRMMNRATAQTNVQTAEEEGLAPKMRWIADLINLIIQRKMQFSDIEFAWVQNKEVDPEIQANVDKVYVSSGVKTINEVRDGLGLDPLPFKEADEPGVLTQNGFVPLTAGVIGQPGAVGSAAGPAGKMLVGNMQDHADEQEAKLQARGEQAHARALELQTAKGKGLPGEEAPPEAGGPAPRGQPKTKKVKGGNGHSRIECTTHPEYKDGCFRCALSRLQKVEDVYELSKAGQRKFRVED